MADYATMPMPELLRVFDSLKPESWRAAADTWRQMATGINETQTSLDLAWQNMPVFHLNEHDPEAKAFLSFKDNVGFSHNSAQEWGTFATNVADRLVATATVIEGNRPFVDAARRDWELADDDRKESVRRRAAVYVWNVSNAVRDTFNGVAVPANPYQGPLGSKPGDDAAGGGDPSAAGVGDAGAGAGAGTPGGGDVGGLGAGDQPAAPPAEAPKAPEAEDPLDRADKVLDVAGKGIDLLGKPADVASKYVGLAQGLKDLLGQGGTGTEGLDPGSLIPDDLYTPDQPTLAGGVGTAPAFDPGTLTGGGSAGAGGLPTTTPVVGPGPAGTGGGLGATGAVGSAPSLAGKATSASAAGGLQQSMPPMYPPMGGMGAPAGGGGRGDIKPGTAAPRAGGFSLPAEQSESERWRRHGVQADLQGRAGGDHRTASAVPALRKRKGSARTARPAEQDVLDEELWRP